MLVVVSLACSGNPQPETITIASWNLKNFGQTKLNDPSRIDVIVDVLKGYDITAIQEVQDVSQGLAPALIEKINASGLNYNYVISERVGRTRMEQYLFISSCGRLIPLLGRMMTSSVEQTRIGSRLREIREYLNETPTVFEERFGLSRHDIANYERGERSQDGWETAPPLAVLASKVDENYLISG